MDAEKASELEAKLRGTVVNGWTIVGLINNGKSAAVFQATKDGDFVALKLFDDELIEKYGDGTQLARIERELELVGHRHPNLVQILDGGVDSATGNHFIAMQLLRGPNLKQALQEIPAENIPSLVEQLASAAKFLDERGYVHRDIKPENIVLLDDHRTLVLLDFGVIRPLAGSSLTDGDGVQPFVGTLQYSSPEFLLRQEEDSPNGWRSLTYYQIGGVMHDLIMRRPLFEEFETPYPRLVNAVQFTAPEIQNSAVPRYLVETARCCLLKDWKKRLDLVTWDSFKVPSERVDERGSSRQRFTNRALIVSASLQHETTAPTLDDGAVTSRILSDARDMVSFSVRSVSAENSVLPPVTVTLPPDNKNEILVRYKASADVGIATDLLIVFIVEIVDVAARIVRIHCGAMMGNATFDACAKSAKTETFRGTLETGVIFEMVENWIYSFLEIAQQTTPATAGEAVVLVE